MGEDLCQAVRATRHVGLHHRWPLRPAVGKIGFFSPLRASEGKIFPSGHSSFIGSADQTLSRKANAAEEEKQTASIPFWRARRNPGCVTLGTRPSPRHARSLKQALQTKEEVGLYTCVDLRLTGTPHNV
jgi:hypothetical protein